MQLKMEKQLKEKIEQAPKAPGCYLFKDSQGLLIYVGKSKLLHSRVKQYFQKSNQTDDRRQSLARNIRDVEFLVTETETDALIQEYRLIKAHKPWYNTQLKADHKHACLKITNEKPYPALLVIEEQGPRRRGDQVFGYFRSKDDAKRALALLGQVYQMPDCGRSFARRDKEPCLRYHLGQCLGPCGDRVKPDAYGKTIREITSLLKGRRTAVFARLKEKMVGCVETLDFEGAAGWRNLSEELDYLRQRSCRLRELPQNRDAVVFLRAYGEDRFSMFFLRRGQTVWREDFAFMKLAQADEGLQRFLTSWEEGQVNSQLADQTWLSRCLTDIYADRRILVLPQKLTRKKLEAAIRREHQLFVRER